METDPSAVMVSPGFANAPTEVLYRGAPWAPPQLAAEQRRWPSSDSQPMGFTTIRR